MIMEVWQFLPSQFRTRVFESLQEAPKEDAWGLRGAAAVLPQTKLEPSEAWKILELLFEEPKRGSENTFYEEFPWAYLFIHLEEASQHFLDKLNAWARKEPASFAYTMLEGFIEHWKRIPTLWRNCLFHARSRSDFLFRDKFIRITARRWNRVPQPFRELFDALARSPKASVRALVGSQTLFNAERYPDLELYALEASRDPKLIVRLDTLRWGRGDEAHHRVAEAILNNATPGVAAAVMLDLLEEEVREEIAPWEKEVLDRCESLGGDAAKAAIASAIFSGKKRAQDLGYKLADSPFEEPEIVRAAWLWEHLNSNRPNPIFSDDDLKRLLQGFKKPRIRFWCVGVTSYKSAGLSEDIRKFLNELGESSEKDAAAIREGAEVRKSRRPLAFHIHRLVT